MVWTIKYTEIAAKQMKRHDKTISNKIDKYLTERVAKGDPARFGKPLLHDKSGLWRYRVENYRIICEFKGKQLIVLVLRVGQRKDVYLS